MKIHKIFFGDSPSISVYENVLKVKKNALKNLFFEKIIFRVGAFRTLQKPNHLSEKINSSRFGKRTLGLTIKPQKT